MAVLGFDATLDRSVIGGRGTEGGASRVETGASEALPSLWAWP